MTRKKTGFTLIELMIVVAIIGILAAIAIPKFAELIRKSGEGASKGNLGSIRSALSIYYGDLEGVYPDAMASLSAEARGLLTAVSNAGGWWYDNQLTDANIGQVLVNCTHTDSKGSVWTVY
jgi:prepilin-type N-terminal cleavage/methylation domain-containing protein